jgi:hypothetical protein
MESSTTNDLISEQFEQKNCDIIIYGLNRSITKTSDLISEQFKPKKCAIIIYGLNRSITKTHPSIEKYILNVLRENNIRYDIFVHTYKLDTLYSNERNHEKPIHIDYKEMYILNPYKMEVDDQNEVDKDHDHYVEYTKHVRGENINIVKNYTRALFSLNKAFNMVDKKNYDGCLIMRPDSLCTEPLNVNNLIDAFDNNIVYTPSDHEWGGLNDRFAFGSFEKITKYATRYTIFLNHLRSKAFTNAERWLKKLYPSVKKTQFRFKTTRTDGRVCNC